MRIILDGSAVTEMTARRSVAGATNDGPVTAVEIYDGATCRQIRWLDRKHSAIPPAAVGLSVSTAAHGFRHVRPRYRRQAAASASFAIFRHETTGLLRARPVQHAEGVLWCATPVSKWSHLDRELTLHKAFACSTYNLCHGHCK